MIVLVSETPLPNELQSRHVRTWRVDGGNLERHMEVQVPRERVRRLREELGPEHRTAVPGRRRVDLHLDALLLARRCRTHRPGRGRRGGSR